MLSADLHLTFYYSSGFLPPTSFGCPEIKLISFRENSRPFVICSASESKAAQETSISRSLSHIIFGRQDSYMGME